MWFSVAFYQDEVVRLFEVDQDGLTDLVRNQLFKLEGWRSVDAGINR